MEINGLGINRALLKHNQSLIVSRQTSKSSEKVREGEVERGRKKERERERERRKKKTIALSPFCLDGQKTFYF